MSQEKFDSYNHMCFTLSLASHGTAPELEVTTFVLNVPEDQSRSQSSICPQLLRVSVLLSLSKKVCVAPIISI